MIPQRGGFREKAQAFLSDYASGYQKHHAETYEVARFRRYAELRQSAEYRALAALAPLGICAESLAAVEARLRAQMERHCAGARLGEGLAHQPVCPDCGLVVDEDIALVAPEQIRSECRSSLGAALTELGRHRANFEAALKSGPGKTAQAVRAALALAPDCAPEQALGAFSPAVVEWLAAALARAQAGARLPVAELAVFLRGKRMTREQALRAFSEWLAAHGAAEQGDTIEFE
jgi:hypothetical protein